MKKKITILIFLIITFCILVGLYVWLVLKIQNTLASVEGFYSDIALSQTKDTSLQNLNRNSRTIIKEDAEIQSLFVQDQSAPDFIQSIETMMQDLKIDGAIKSVSNEQEPELTPLSKDELEVSIEADSSYSNLLNFVSLLENLPYKSYVTSVSLQKNTETDQKTGAVIITKNAPWILDVTLNVDETITSQNQV